MTNTPSSIEEKIEEQIDWKTKYYNLRDEYDKLLTPTVNVGGIKKKFNNFLVKEEVIKKGSDWNERIYNLWNFFLPYLTAGKKEKTPFDNYSDKDIAESFEEERFGFKVMSGKYP